MGKVLPFKKKDDPNNVDMGQFDQLVLLGRKLEDLLKQLTGINKRIRDRDTKNEND